MTTQKFQGHSIVCPTNHSRNLPAGMAINGTNFCGYADYAGANIPAWWFPPGVSTIYWEDGACILNSHDQYFDGWMAMQPYITLGTSAAPAQFGAANNPIQAATLITGTQYLFSNTLNFNVIGPVHMVVQNDIYDHCDGCTTTVRRKTTYQVINSDGSIAKNIPLGEVTDYGSSSCSQGRPTMLINSCRFALGQPIGNPSGPPVSQSDGMWATDSNGQFTDNWTMGSGTYTPAGCGYSVNYDHWQLCGIGLDSQGYINAGLTFATLQGSINSNEVRISVGGHNYVLPGVSTFPPGCQPNQTGCPNAIPNGTVITP
jgi:hypothetical protein